MNTAIPDSDIKEVPMELNHSVADLEKQLQLKNDHQARIQDLGTEGARSKHKNTRNRRVKDSGKWIFENVLFDSWLKGEPATLWCQGKPGTGKTFLCSTIIDHCKNHFDPDEDVEPTGWVAWIYCDYNAKTTQTILQLIKSLIAQFCNAAFDRGGEELNSPLMELTETFGSSYPFPELEDYITLLTDVVVQLKTCTVIIDAFDECAETDDDTVTRRLFIDTLLALPIRLLVTSRDLPPIREIFEHRDKCAELPIENRPGDIQSYIHWRIWDPEHGNTAFQEVVQKDSSLQTSITQAMTEKYPETNFNVAQHHMNIIVALREPGTVRDALDDLPFDEEKVYDRFIERIGSHPDAGVSALRALAWVYAARTPLRKEELAHALVTGLSTDWSAKTLLNHVPSTDTILDWCNGLVVLLLESQTLVFAHPTVKEYFDKRPALLAPYLEAIPKVCIEHLILHTKISNTRLWLFLYAKEFWFRHIEDVNTGIELMPYWSRILDRASNPDMKWMRSYSGRARSRSWLHQPLVPVSPIEIACSLEIPWLITLLSSSGAGTLSASTEETLLAAAQFRPALFPRMYHDLVPFDTRPPESIVAAIATAGADGLDILQHIFVKYPDYRVTRSMMLGAVKSNRPGLTLRVLWEQHKAHLAVLNSSLDATPAEEHPSHPELFIQAANNRNVGHGTLIMLRDTFGTPVDEDAICALAFFSPELAAVWAIQLGIEVSAVEFLEDTARYGDRVDIFEGGGDPFGTIIHALMPRIAQFAKIEITPELINCIQGISDRIGNSIDESSETVEEISGTPGENNSGHSSDMEVSEAPHAMGSGFSWLFQHEKPMTVTQNGARRAAQLFQPSEMLELFKVVSLTPDVALVALDEMRLKLNAFDAMEDEVNTGHPSDVHATLHEWYRSNVKGSKLQKVMDSAVLIAPGQLEETEIEALLRSEAPSLIMARLEMQYGKCTEVPEDVRPDHVMFLSRWIVDRVWSARNETLEDLFVWAFATETNEYFRRLPGQLIDKALIHRASTGTLDPEAGEDIVPVLTYLAMKCLFLSPQSSASLIETLIQVTIHNLRNILGNSLFNLASLSSLPSSIYEAAVQYNGPDASYVHSVLASTLADRDQTWAPPISLFETTAQIGSLEAFNTLQRFNKSKDLFTGYERTPWGESVLRCAVGNTGDDCLGIVGLVLEERQNNDGFKLQPAIDIAEDNNRFGPEVVLCLKEWQRNRQRDLEDWWEEDDMRDAEDWELGSDEDEDEHMVS